MIHLMGLFLVSVTLSWILPESAGAQVIGTTTEARNQVRGEVNAAVRRISTGSGVSSNETISTGRSSAGVFRFVDGSNLNVGERSSVVLDRFVFDPNGPDNVVLNVGRGAMRFVSGELAPVVQRLSHPGQCSVSGIELCLGPR